MSSVTILDVGFSSQLSMHVGEKIDGDPLWTARFLVTNPEAVTNTHLDFLRAGADVISTNTYQATITGFAKYLNLNEEESIKLIKKAVSFAQTAVSQYKIETKGKNVVNKHPLVAGSCGPYGAAQHDGSEYTGTYGKHVSRQLIMDWHRPRVKALLDAGVDLLAIETIPCKEEADYLVDLLKEFPSAKAWLSFSCRDDGVSLADGSSFQEVATNCYEKALPGQLVAVGINCIAPQYVSSFFQNMNKNRQNFIPLVVYPNSGEKYTVEKGWKGEGKWYPMIQFVPEWLDYGVRYLGGCCRTYAEDIVHLREAVKRAQKQQ